MEISGYNTISPIDQLSYASYNAVATTTWIFSTITTTQIKELIVCFFGTEQTFSTAGNGVGWTQLGGENDGGNGQTSFCEYQSAPAGGTFTGTATLSFPQTIDTGAYTLSVKGA
jgi:hypothetical protein